jgi:AcrR family transcriptional regulator
MAGVKGQIQQRGVQRREAILEAAIAVFARDGERGGALAEIGARAGTTRAGVLHHFGSKEALLLAAIQERDRRAGEDFFALGHEGGVAMLRGLMRYAVQTEREPGLAALHTTLLVENLHRRSAAHQYFQGRATEIRRVLAAGLEAGKRRGELRADIDCEAVAGEVLAFQEGASIMARLVDSPSLTELYRHYFDNLIARIAEPPPARVARRPKRE